MSLAPLHLDRITTYPSPNRPVTPSFEDSEVKDPPSCSITEVALKELKLSQTPEEGVLFVFEKQHYFAHYSRKYPEKVSISNLSKGDSGEEGNTKYIMKCPKVTTPGAFVAWADLKERTHRKLLEMQREYRFAKEMDTHRQTHPFPRAPYPLYDEGVLLGLLYHYYELDGGIFFKADLSAKSRVKAASDLVRGYALVREKGKLYVDPKPDNILVKWVELEGGERELRVFIIDGGGCFSKEEVRPLDILFPLSTPAYCTYSDIRNLYVKPKEAFQDPHIGKAFESLCRNVRKEAKLSKELEESFLNKLEGNVEAQNAYQSYFDLHWERRKQQALFSEFLTIALVLVGTFPCAEEEDARIEGHTVAYFRQRRNGFFQQEFIDGAVRLYGEEKAQALISFFEEVLLPNPKKRLKHEEVLPKWEQLMKHLASA